MDKKINDFLRKIVLTDQDIDVSFREEALSILIGINTSVKNQDNAESVNTDNVVFIGINNDSRSIPCTVFREIEYFLGENKKLNAVKLLRNMLGCEYGLFSTRKAVEDTDNFVPRIKPTDYVWKYPVQSGLNY